MTPAEQSAYEAELYHRLALPCPPFTGTIIKFRLLEGPLCNDGLIAFSQEHLWATLDGDFAEIIMPARPWLVRMWRRFFPLRGVEIPVGGFGEIGR